ncbi:MAG: thioredoxin family protein [Luteolibacter sp.]
MKRFAALACLIPFLVSCDKIDLVAEKINEINPVKEKESKETKTAGSAETKITKAPGPAVRQLDGSQFREFISQPGQLNIVDFHAGWCPPCRKIGPELEALANEYSSLCRLGKIDIDREKASANPRTSAAFLISASTSMESSSRTSKEPTPRNTSAS